MFDIFKRSQLIKDYYKMIGIDLIKQQVLDADLETIQQINFATNPDRDGNPKMFFIIEETKETILDFLRGTVQAL